MIGSAEDQTRMRGKRRSGPSSAELRGLGLSVDIDEIIAKRIQGKLLVVDGALRQGRYDTDSFQHFHQAYDAVAEEIVAVDTPDGVLEDMIPRLVHRFGQQQKWLPWMDFEMLVRFLEGSVAEWRGRRLLMDPGARPKPPKPRPPETREPRLQRFLKRKKTTVAAVTRAARTHKANMQQWRRGELSDESVISQRIESVLRGKTPILPTPSQG